MSNETNFLGNDERTNEVYDFIIRYKRDHDGNSPTIREIGAECDISSTGIVSYHLDKLAADGRIVLSGGGKTRSISVPGYSWRRDSEVQE